MALVQKRTGPQMIAQRSGLIVTWKSIAAKNYSSTHVAKKCGGGKKNRRTPDKKKSTRPREEHLNVHCAHLESAKAATLPVTSQTPGIATRGRPGTKRRGGGEVEAHNKLHVAKKTRERTSRAVIATERGHARDWQEGTTGTCASYPEPRT